MGKQIAGKAGAVIPPTSPPKKSLQAELVIWRRADELLPIYIVRPGFFANVVNPRPIRAISVGGYFYQVNFSKDTFFISFFCFEITFVCLF
ncbi:MAG: hypothetical protein R2750_13495 [Bacteroidales bacterium]